MTSASRRIDASGAAPREASAAPPGSGSVLRRIVRRTTRLMLPMAGKRWNPIFAVLEHRGRKSGRRYATPVAARRVDGGFVISLAFGAQVDWYRNLLAAGGGTIRWRRVAYPVGAPERIDAGAGVAAFNPVQRVALRFSRVDGYVRVPDVDPSDG
jgi:deazaflavin-dependent oxidoreductase (nitroreductase family)